MHRLEQHQWNRPPTRFACEPHFCVHLWTSLAWSGPSPVSILATPITSEKTDVNLILPVRVSRTHRGSPPTWRSLSDNCPDFEWHQSQSSVTLILSRSRLRWTDGGWPIYTPVTWSLAPPQARNIKLTAAYSEMCDCPGPCRYSGLSAFLFLTYLDKHMVDCLLQVTNTRLVVWFLVMKIIDTSCFLLENFLCIHSFTYSVIAMTGFLLTDSFFHSFIHLRVDDKVIIGVWVVIPPSSPLLFKILVMYLFIRPSILL